MSNPPILFTAAIRADILVAHEAPSSHGHGLVALDDLARRLGARLIVPCHHHGSSACVTRDGIRVVGLARDEALLLPVGSLP